MPVLKEADVEKRVYENSLNTCHYVSGYVNRYSEFTVECEIHKIQFTTKYENVARATRKHHICPKCKEEDNIARSTKIECTCNYCGTVFLRTPSKIRSELLFCSRECKDLAQRIESGEKFNTIRPKHYTESGMEYRAKALRNYINECAICGWNEDVDVLEVHHIDENRANNELDNLIVLCPICHRKLTTGKYELINRTEIIKK